MNFATITPMAKNPTVRSRFPRGLFLIALLFGCLAVSEQALAQGPPDQGNTRLGQNALHNVTTGESNTAIGWRAVALTTTGDPGCTA